MAGKMLTIGMIIACLTFTSHAAPVLYQVAPESTDIAIDAYLSPHYVYIDTSLSLRERILVFLPGSGATPAVYTQLLTHAATLGYRVIGLTYPNSPTVGSLCAISRDSSCFEDVRLESLYGSDAAKQVSVTPANSLQNRLVKLLGWLRSNHPGQGWGAYLDNKDSVAWSKVVISGHSQGGGTAVLIARDHAVARVVQFSSVADFSLYYKKPAFWLTTDHATPASCYFGFSHVMDSTVPWVQLQQNWTALGMDTYDKACIDSTAPNFASAHELYTRVPSAHPAGLLSYHDCTAVNNASTKDNSGASIFTPVWTYLLTAPDSNTQTRYQTVPSKKFSSSNNNVIYFDLNGRMLKPSVVRAGTGHAVVIQRHGEECLIRYLFK